MKKYFIITIFLFSNRLFAQTQSNVNTPIGNPVTAYITPEMSDADRKAWDKYYEWAYPNATQLDTYGNRSSSGRFNCHGYAWYMMSNEGSGLNDPRWIGYYYTTDEDIYMTDGSYKEVPNEVSPGKVSWASGDHSAITTSTPGKYRSKWNKYPLMEHQWDDTPFGTTNLKYYKLCFEKIENVIIYSDFTKNGCKFLMKNVTIQNNADINITVEDWFKIEGTFNAQLGTTLNVVP